MTHLPESQIQTVLDEAAQSHLNYGPREFHARNGGAKLRRNAPFSHDEPAPEATRLQLPPDEAAGSERVDGSVREHDEHGQADSLLLRGETSLEGESLQVEQAEEELHPG